MIRAVRGMVRFVGDRSYAAIGVGYAPGGAQDRYSCALGNILLGNPPTAGALECTMAPAQFRVEQACRILVGGAPVEVRVNGVRRRRWEVLGTDAGSRVELRPTGVGCRSYLCVGGGIVPGENAFEDKSYAVGEARHVVDPGVGSQDWDRKWEPAPGVLRILPGPEFSEAAEKGLQDGSWQVSRQSSGMGAVLEGLPLGLASHDILSAPVQDGSVQSTGKGLIALLRDRGTLGGYPRVATVIDCDVDRLAQLLPGNRVRFELVDRNEARRLCLLQEKALLRVVAAVRESTGQA